MEEKQLTSLRFGIMVDDLLMEAWKVETVRKLVESGTTLALVIRNDAKPEKKSFFKKILTYPGRRAFFQVWNHYLFKPDCKAMVSLEEALASSKTTLSDLPIIDCKPIEKGTSTYLLDNDIETIKNQNLDFILRFGFNILKGEILLAAKYGIWSFHHDDEMVYRGGPPGFWEWMHDDPRNGILLQRLTESLDKGYILKKRWYPTILHSYKAHLNQLYFESTEMPLQVCQEIQHLGILESALSESKAVVYHAPTNLNMLGYWIKCITRRIRFHLHDLFRQEDWNVGYVEVPLSTFIESPLEHDAEIKWFKRKRRSMYNADPFVFTTEKDTYVFFESYSYRKGKGCIKVAKWSEGFKKHHQALEEDYHLSYPFVFEHDGKVYCLPESNESNKLVLYCFNENNLKLERDGVLMEPVKAIDPTLLSIDGRWNLFFTKKDYPSVKLYRYIADDLHGTFEPFYANPVIVDCAGARMAGRFFEYRGSLVRPAQECVRYYGTGVSLRRVMTINDSQYREEPFDNLEPFKNSPYKQGLHTINGNSAITVFDGKRWTFTFAGFFHQLKIKRNNKKK